MASYGEHRMWWDESKKLVRVIGAGLIDGDAARWYLAQTERMAQEHGGELDWLLDLSLVTKSTVRARKLVAQAAGHPSIRRYAMVGASTFVRTVTNFVLAASGRTNNRHFATEEEALRWLRES
jgi:hypothetical protein